MFQVFSVAETSDCRLHNWLFLCCTYKQLLSLPVTVQQHVNADYGNACRLITAAITRTNRQTRVTTSCVRETKTCDNGDKKIASLI